ncbi:uncharacterized protein ALTATR162_LOCUS6139 [Alternaria atra]|uniref:Uncharacterized protein n=1 Tax=Alternaria atra TaxID=119953 RepID=A0A8J2I3X2_9PLEO|nr:uncharacterized protein ALTATR162_LOCUS6139 [Alternaria atra]CAG5161997.1 unnamed protein product [Alternaria atra]
MVPFSDRRAAQKPRRRVMNAAGRIVDARHSEESHREGDSSSNDASSEPELSYAFVQPKEAKAIPFRVDTPALRNGKPSDDRLPNWRAGIIDCTNPIIVNTKNGIKPSIVNIGRNTKANLTPSSVRPSNTDNMGKLTIIHSDKHKQLQPQHKSYDYPFEQLQVPKRCVIRDQLFRCPCLWHENTSDDVHKRDAERACPLSSGVTLETDHEDDKGERGWATRAMSFWR